MSKPNQKMNVKGVPEYLGPDVPQTTQITEQQKALTPADAALAIILAKPAGTFKTANAAEFQPTERHDPSGALAGINAENYFQPGERGTMPGARGDLSPSRIVGD